MQQSVEVSCDSTEACKLRVICIQTAYNLVGAREVQVPRGGNHDSPAVAQGSPGAWGKGRDGAAGSARYGSRGGGFRRKPGDHFKRLKITFGIRGIRPGRAVVSRH